MEITVSKTALLDKLKSIGRIIQPKNSLPAYDNFLFVVDEFGIIIVTAGEEGGRISTNIDGKSDFTSRSFMANAKTLLDGLKEIPEQPLAITIYEKELVVKYANGKFSIPIEKGDQYPAMNTDNTAIPFLVSGTDLLYGIRQVQFCSANDELRPVLNGVYFDIGLEYTSFVATDGTRLAMIENPNSYTRKERAAFILPSKFAKVLSNIVPEDCMQVEISVNQTNILIEFDSYRLICRMIEGRFPNYRAVIPQKQPNRAVLKKTDIVSALKRVSVFCDENSSLVVLKFSLDSLKITAHNLDFCKSAEETVTLQSGCDIEIGFRSNFLIEMVNNIPSEDIAITMSDPSQASLLTRCDEKVKSLTTRSSGNPDFTLEAFYEYLEKFFMKLQNEGETAKSPKDAMSHFARWLTVELKNKKDERRINKSRNAGGTKAVADSPGDSSNPKGSNSDTTGLTGWIDSLSIGR